MWRGLATRTATSVVPSSATATTPVVSSMAVWGQSLWATPAAPNTTTSFTSVSASYALPPSSIPSSYISVYARALTTSSAHYNAEASSSTTPAAAPAKKRAGRKPKTAIPLPWSDEPSSSATTQTQTNSPSNGDAKSSPTNTDESFVVNSTAPKKRAGRPKKAAVSNAANTTVANTATDAVPSSSSTDATSTVVSTEPVVEKKKRAPRKKVAAAPDSPAPVAPEPTPLASSSSSSSSTVTPAEPVVEKKKRASRKKTTDAPTTTASSTAPEPEPMFAVLEPRKPRAKTPPPPITTTTSSSSSPSLSPSSSTVATLSSSTASREAAEPLTESPATAAVVTSVMATEKKTPGRRASTPPPPPSPPIVERAEDLPPVTVVDSPESAARVLAMLTSPEVRDLYHAIDTEVVGIDLDTQGPVGNGRIICISIYCGEHLNFGNGPRIWIDNMDRAEGTLALFKDYLQDKTIKKVFHNYGFDCHVFGNMGIKVDGFAADTMVMARLWDAGRTTRGGYSLEALSELFFGEKRRKRPMIERFGQRKPKRDGSEGKTFLDLDLEKIQRDELTRPAWMDYSTYDTESTWMLREELEKKLRAMPWNANIEGKQNMFEFYQLYYRPFTQLLCDMEREGIYIRHKDYLPIIERDAEADRVRCEKKFRDWAITQCESAVYMNIGSASQKQQFFFGPYANNQGELILPAQEEFETPNTDGFIEEGKKKALKNKTFMLRGLGMKPKDFTPTGLPQVSAAVLRELAGEPDAKPPKWGSAWQHFGGGTAGEEACRAIGALCELTAIEQMLNTFIKPLQQLPDERGRLHSSFGINTETGRLSSRRPNLQNQPALEKDKYKVRDAFCAEPGNLLIVADYGQLELRVLAHMANCKSMIDAFKAGGDFHSRTAMGMYDNVRQAIEKKEVLLEWNKKDGPAPAPLLKDIFASERRKAKMLNFSIAYGKTARGLAEDWQTSLADAEATLERWFADRPEVRQLQSDQKKEAKATGSCRTLMGRYRPLPDINSGYRPARGHAERAAINSPIQGGAADIVMMSMLKIHSDERLRALGWRMVLQVHDEIIAEGPKESVDEAMKIIKMHMSRPFEKPLLVDLVIDAKAADSWYKAK